MQRHFLFGSLAGLALLAGVSCESGNVKLAKTILHDPALEYVDSLAREVVKSGFNAGDGYGEVWIRDYNTFIELAMEVMPDSLIRDNLLTFFRFQGKTGDIVDGFIGRDKAVNTPDGYKYRYSALEPRYAAHKNTVETDQESSLIQAVWRYVMKSGNRGFLMTDVGGRTVEQRMESALDYLLKERFSQRYGLLWGATTADWGDVQPEHPWGVAIDQNTHYSIDIYDNAFFLIAIDCFTQLTSDEGAKVRWQKVADQVRSAVRRHLWDEELQKFIPHIYLDGSPFPSDLDERAIFYHGGTAVAVEAGLLTRDEVAVANRQMVDNVRKSGAPSIGLTVYPPYPEGCFQNKGMGPYSYQNGGDWSWFGGRMIRQLVDYGFVEEAYTEGKPMFDRVVKNRGFYEWYRIDGTPSGSGTFRGEAGVLYDCVGALRAWAREQLSE